MLQKINVNKSKKKKKVSTIQSHFKVYYFPEKKKKKIHNQNLGNFIYHGWWATPAIKFVLCQPNLSWRRKWQPIPVFLLGKSYGQRYLEG